MRRRARTLPVAVAVLVCALVALAAPAIASMFDYTLSGTPNDTWSSRFVGHDYTQIKGRVTSGVTVCVSRGANGASFCADTTSSHSWTDLCGGCFSYYKQKSGTSLDIAAHDEW
jgi:hypothetical protein